MSCACEHHRCGAIDGQSARDYAKDKGPADRCGQIEVGFSSNQGPTLGEARQ